MWIQETGMTKGVNTMTESDDTGPEGDTEKDKDTFGSIQRRRMARPKGGSQASQREPRFRSKMRDGEG